MAVSPEVVLHKVLVVGFRELRKNPKLLDTVFTNLTQPEVAKIKNFVIEKSIDFGINYPRTTPKLPGMYLLLRSENEAQAFLGNIAGASPNYDTPDDYFTYDSDSDSSPPTTLGGTSARIIGNLKVQNSRGSRLTFQAEESDRLEALLDAGDVPPPAVHVISGTGAGQSHVVTKLSTISLDIDGIFDPQLDTTSIVELRAIDGTEVVGEPSKVFEEGASNVTRYGVNYSAQYQLAILSGSQEEVLYLYNIVKAILLSQTTFLEGQGILGLQISGSDFAPRSEYLPNDVFQRMMNLQFTYPFDFLQESGTAFSSISIAIQCALEDDCCDSDFSIPV